MKMMKILSKNARQNITYLCRNSFAWKNNQDKTHRKTIKLLMDNEKEVHGRSKVHYMQPKIILDECKVCTPTII